MNESGRVPGGSTTIALSGPFRPGRCARWACVYALAVIYVSVVPGPFGLTFVPRDPAAAWRMLLATPYLVTGSDQRPDWMANLIMLIPLGFLASGALWPERGAFRRVAGAGAALIGCIIFVAAVKYLQLFFPPRTVSLNYFIAQSLGSLIGVALFCLFRGRLTALRADLAGGGDRPMIALGGFYVVGWLLFLLFPFDVALSGEDLRVRAAVLPQLLLSWPGAKLPLGLRLAIPLAEAAATIPIGVWLALPRRNWPLFRIALTGFLMMSAATVASMLLLDTTPSVAALAFRTVGIVLGGMLARRLAGSDPGRWHDRLARLVPGLIAPYVYVVAVLYVKNLLSLDWRTMPEALAALDWRGLLPFFNDYIVSKEHAALSVAFELICYGPIGVMIALRRGGGRVSIWLAAAVALAFSIEVEFGRWLRPGLQPDFSDPIVAAVGAGLAVNLTALFWRAAATGRVAITIGRAREQGANRGRQTCSAVPEPLGRRSRETHSSAAFLRLLVSLGCLTIAGIAAAAYPLAPWLLGTGLALYAMLLWRWPSLWLAVLPALLPALDLAPWTGWTMIGEPDLFVLVTIGVLALRAPPRTPDFCFRGLAAVAIALTLVSCVAGVALGLAMPGPAGGSDNPYLRPDNALRVAKGLATAVALLPFLRERLRGRCDALIWLGAGMAAGLSLVAAAAIVERAMFPGLFNFSAGYRVVATFSSAHMGGGYTGAYLTMGLPFLLVFAVRPRTLPLLAMVLIALAAGYALIVTFARTAYAAASLSVAVACLAWGWSGRRAGNRTRNSAALPGFLLLAVGGIVIAGAATPEMSGRLAETAQALAGRETAWRQSLALRDRGVLTTLLGMGFGTYPRAALTHKPGGQFPTNFVLDRDGGYRFWLSPPAVTFILGKKYRSNPTKPTGCTWACDRPIGAPRRQLPSATNGCSTPILADV